MPIHDDDDDIQPYKFPRPEDHDSIDEDPDTRDVQEEMQSVDFAQCPQCHKYFYAEAFRCPRCGHLMTETPWTKKPLWYVLTVGVAIVLIVLFWILR